MGFDPTDIFSPIFHNPLTDGIGNLFKGFAGMAGMLASLVQLLPILLIAGGAFMVIRVIKD